ncbi:MAG: hypothetical protein AAF355_15490 [Myxococcota bacterium]
MTIVLHEMFGHLGLGRLGMDVSGSRLSPFELDHYGFSGVSFPLENTIGANSLGRELGCVGQSALMSVAGVVPPLLVSALMTNFALRTQLTRPRRSFWMSPWFTVPSVFAQLATVTDAMRPSRHIMARIQEDDCLGYGFPGSGTVGRDESGHDFYTLTANMHQILQGRGYSLTPLQVSMLMTTIIFCLTLGTSIVGMMLSFAHENRSAPRGDVLLRWVTNTRDDKQNVSPELSKLAARYSRTNRLKKALEQPENKTAANEIQLFWDYVERQIPYGELSSLQSQVIEDWNQAASPNRLERLLRVGAAYGVGIAFLQPMLSLLGDTIMADKIGPLGRVLRGNTPLLMAPLATLSGVSGLKTAMSDLPATVKLVAWMQAAISLSALCTLMKVSPRTRSSHFDNFALSWMVSFTAIFAHLTLSCARRRALQDAMRRKRNSTFPH